MWVARDGAVGRQSLRPRLNKPGPPIDKQAFFEERDERGSALARLRCGTWPQPRVDGPPWPFGMLSATIFILLREHAAVPAVDLPPA